MNEELYNDEIHTILDILSDEELYILKIYFIANVQTFFSHLITLTFFSKFETSAETIDHSKNYFIAFVHPIRVPDMRRLVRRVDHYIFQKDGDMYI